MENQSLPALNSQPIDVEQLLFRASAKQLKNLIIATVIIVSSFWAGYFAIERKDAIQDLQLETMRLQVQEMKVSLQNMQQQLNSKKDKQP